MLTVLEVVQKTTEFLLGKGVENPRLNAELIVGHALGLKRMQLYLQFERLLAEAELERIRPLVRRRGQREPIQYITGETEWFGMKLKVDRRALIPRPETEYLAEWLTNRIPGAMRILDLGTGTGALALALARHYGSAEVVAVDLSVDALALARENAAALGLADRIAFLQSDWFQAVAPEPRFDLIVANPPYLSEAETVGSEAEVHAFEPKTALTSGDEGMEDLKVIITGARTYLSESGHLALETGIHQHAALSEFARRAGFNSIESKTDLAGRDRFLLVSR